MKTTRWAVAQFLIITLMALFFVACVSSTTSQPAATFLPRPTDLPTMTDTPMPARTPALTATPTVTPTHKSWLGMSVPIDTWKNYTIVGNPKRVGLLTHRTIPGCQVTITSEEPKHDPSATGWYYRFDGPISVNAIAYWRMVAKDAEGNTKLVYFDVADTHFKTYQFHRLAYFLVDFTGQPEQCTRDVEALLSTIEPKSFPRMLVGQG